MPTTASAEEKPKKRAPRKRAVGSKTVRKTAVKKTVRKRAPRKQAVRKATSATVERAGSDRKAPTPIAAQRASGKAKQKQLIVLFSVLVISIGVSAALGFSDEGQIDVNRAIEERNDRIRSGQSSGDGLQNIVVPVQNTEANKLPDGGLVGLGKPEKPKPEPAETASTTASSTDETATSTEESAEGEVEIDTNEGDGEELEEATEPEANTGEEITVEPTSGR